MEPTKTYIIYKIICNTVLPDDQVYIGSTCNFSTRKNGHKRVCNNINGKSYNLKVYQTIRDNGGWDNWRMDYVEQLPNHTLVQSKIREQYYINLFKSKLNSQNAYTDQVAYRQEYNATHKEYHKEYSVTHKETKGETARNYYYNNQEKIKAITNCPCGVSYQHKSKASHFKSARHMRYLAGLSNEHDLALVNVMEVPA